MRSRTFATRHAAAALAVAVGVLLTGCAPDATAAHSRVVVRIAAKDRPHYDVRLAAPDGGFRAASRMRPGETRTFTVPAGWVTVRVPGLCVVPTATTTGTTTIDVEPDDCTVD